MQGYTNANMHIWLGRNDSDDDYDSFFWHQHIQGIDLASELSDAPTALSFVLIGYKVEEGIRLNKGRVGAAQGPDKVRDFLKNKPCSFSKDIKIYDGGNIEFITTVEDAQATLATLVKKCLAHKYFPIVIGGGHDIAYGTMSGLIDYLPITKRNFGIINFDAHFDLRPYQYSTSGTMFRQIYDDITKQNASFNHMTIGIQRSSNTTSLFNFAKSINSQYIMASDLNNDSMSIPKKVNNFIDKQDDIYVTVCCDVFSSPYAPGVSSPQPLGIHPEKFLKILKQILRKKKVVAFDIAEISPQLDSSNSTASLGALIIFSIVNFLAEITE